MEEQTLNPFRAPTASGQAPATRPGIDAAPPPVWLFRELPISVALVAIIFIAYWGVWQFDFVYFDDPGYVTDNLNVKRGLPLFTSFKVFCDSVAWAFTAFEQSNWHPLTWLSHMLDVQLYGVEAAGHHVTNIILHLSNTLLLFWLLRWLTGRRWPSAAVAALFAVHPMHVESVVWIAERKDVLSTFLGLLTLLAYVRYTKNPGVYRYIPVFVLLALGLLAKPMLVTIPCVCLLLDYWPLGRLKQAGNADWRARQALAERAPVPRRKAKRNQRLPAAARAPRIKDTSQGTPAQRAVRLVVEKIPLFALAAISAAITPIAQAHGGSMASSSELSFAFRIENSLQSYLTYITRMFWPGKMSVLYLLDVGHVNHFYTAAAVVTLVSITALVIWGAYHGRRYLAVGWFWYIGTLVPVIGIVQVGEQTHADRYTYIPYVGLFIMLAWGIADLIGLLPQLRKSFQFATGFAMALLLTTCVDWTAYQLQFWTGVEKHLRHALTITPDNWNMLNNLGVKLWKKAQDEDAEAAKAEAEGNLEAAKKCHEKAVALKVEAVAQWEHGIASRPTATDIHSNLGYYYSEINNLDKAEWHLNCAVELKPISPRPRNNLGRVLLRRSQQFEADAREAEAKGKTDPAEAAKVQGLKDLAKTKRDKAIEQFEEAVKLDSSLLEARLNLGEVFLSLSDHDKAENNLDQAENDLDKAESHYRAIVRLHSESEKDRETINNYSQAWFGLARIALVRNKPDEAIDCLQQSVELNPKNEGALQLLARLQFERGEYRKGENTLWSLLAVQSREKRRAMADQFGGQFEVAGKHAEAAQVWNFTAWAFAASPDPHLLDLEAATAWARVLRIRESDRLPDMRDPEAATILAQRVVAMTKQQDPASIDTLAAAHAAGGRYSQAVQAAQFAINLANSQGKKPLVEAIARRLQFYQQGRPYLCDPNGSDRP